MKESTVEDYLVAQCEARNGLCEKHVAPGRRGPPDRLITWAKKHPKRPMHLVETKRPKGGKLAPWQKRDHEERAKRGIPVYLLWSKEEVDLYMYGIDHWHSEYPMSDLFSVPVDE